MLLFNMLFSPAVMAQRKTPLDDLFLPHHTPRRMAHGKNYSWVILSEQPLEQVMKYYLNLCTPTPKGPAHWQLTAPDLLTATAWIGALSQTPSKKTGNFILNLHHKQTKLNFSLTLGVASFTRDTPIRSIITLYAVPERRGGTPDGINGSSQKKNQKSE